MMTMMLTTKCRRVDRARRNLHQRTGNISGRKLKIKTVGMMMREK
uniref:Similar to EMB2733/ESP3 (EMBRYO DEFECTIVE 2733) n=1 Tax=Arundo donax TaxID=35708 RepID=A0A0A9D418_ARUDO